MPHPLRLQMIIASPGPRALHDSLAHPFDEGLSLKVRTRQAPMDHPCATTLLGHRSDAKEALRRTRLFKTITIGAEDH